MYRKEDLLADIKKMGIDPHGTILIHSSMKSIGEVEGGGDTVIDAWCEYMKDGLLIFPTHTWNILKDENPVYDMVRTPSRVGILTNLFLKRPGVARSVHPTHSVAAIGKGASAYLKSDLNVNTPCGRAGCWGKLIDLQAEILFLGCTLRSNTFIHGVEEWNQVPDRISKTTRPITVIPENGDRYIKHMYTHYCSFTDDVSQYYGKLEPVFEKYHAIRRGTFGDAACIIGNAEKMNRITSYLLQSNPALFANGDVIPEESYENIIF